MNPLVFVPAAITRALALAPASALVRVIYSSILASAVVTVAFSLALLGLVRGADLRRANRTAPAMACTLAALLALILCGAAVVYGLVLVGQKH